MNELWEEIKTAIMNRVERVRLEQEAAKTKKSDAAAAIALVEHMVSVERYQQFKFSDGLIPHIDAAMDKKGVSLDARDGLIRLKDRLIEDAEESSSKTEEADPTVEAGPEAQY